MTLPNFLIPGAGKSGTTFLANSLAAHPDIYIPEIKEPCYFSRHDVFGSFHKGIAFYQKHFDTYAGQQFIGEASTVYMYDENSPLLIKEALGNIPLIFVLRDPIQRIHSNYWQELKAGASLPIFSEFVRSGGDRFNEMVSVTRYDKHIARFEGHFPKESILLLDFRKLINTPQLAIDEVTNFLKLPEFIAPDVEGVEKNIAAVARYRWLAKILRNRKLANAIKSTIPTSLLPRLKQVGDTFKKRNLSTIEYQPVDPATELLLREILSDTYAFMRQQFDGY